MISDISGLFLVETSVTTDWSTRAQYLHQTVCPSLPWRTSLLAGKKNLCHDHKISHWCVPGLFSECFDQFDIKP